MRPYMLEIPKESSAKDIEKIKAIFGAKVTMSEFPEHEEKIEKNTLKDLQSKHNLTVDD